LESVFAPGRAAGGLEAADRFGVVARIVGLTLAAAEMVGAVFGRELHAGVAGPGRDQLDRLLDEMAEIDGLAGVMLTFDDFIIGIEQFGQRIQPLMRSRARLAAAA